MQVDTAGDPRALPFILDRLAGLSSCQSQVARNPGSPVDTLDRLAADRSADWNVRHGLAKNNNIPFPVLRRLASDPAKIVRAAVVTNLSCTREILSQLASDLEPDVRLAVASHPFCQSSVLILMAGDTDPRVCTAVIRHANLSREVLERFGDNPMLQNPAYARKVAQHPACPPAVLAKLSQNTSFRVRQEVARHPDTPTEVIVELTQDAGDIVVATAAGHPNCPPGQLRQLSRDSRSDVRTAVAANPSCPTDTLLWIGSHIKDRKTLVGLAANPSCPPALLEQLLQNTYPAVAQAAADNQNLPRAALAMWQLAHR